MRKLVCLSFAAPCLIGACSSPRDNNLFAPLAPIRSDADASSAGDSPRGSAGGASSQGGTSTNSGGASTVTGDGGITNESTGGSTGHGGTSSGSAGTASSGGAAGGSQQSSVCDGKTRRLQRTDTFVDDFEKGKLDERWYSFADTSSFQKLFLEHSGALGTQWSGHFFGSNARLPSDGGFGVGIGVNFGCVDVSELDGVSFWARGFAGRDNVLTFRAVLAETQPVAAGGDCKSDCYNHPAFPVTLRGDWSHYVVRFADLAGNHRVKGVILGLNWISPGPNFDFWIDEVSLFSGSAPSGAVSPR
jgi:hypothetical protein